MRVLHLTAGTGSYHCGSCIRDNALVAALQALGHEALLVPLYLPLVVDGEDCSVDQPLFLGGINTYLQQNMPLFRRVPGWVNRVLDARPIMKRVVGVASLTNPVDLGEMTLSLLQGFGGHQAAEIRRLAAWIRDDIQPDVVVMSNGLLAGVGVAIRELCGVKVVCTLQSELHFVDGLLEPHRGQVWTQMAAALQNLDGVVAVSEYCKEQTSKRCGLAADDICVIPSGLDIRSFKPRETHHAPPVLGYFARLSEEKGALVALQAFESLRQRAGLTDLRLHMGGSVAPGGQSFVNTLTTAASDLQAVHIASNLSTAEKATFFQGMSVLCVPGRMHEVAGLYVIEALASGVPVVAAGEGGAGELIRATGGGLTYSASKPSAMIDALETVLTDPALQLELGTRGQAYVQREHTARAMAKRWLDYLEA